MKRKILAVLAAAVVISGVGMASAQAADWPNVKKGANGADVKTVQHLLSAHGIATDADGDFGGGTEANVIKFQNANGLTGDGQVGPNTWPKLIKTVKKGDKGDAVKAAQVQLNNNGANLTVDGDFGGGTHSAVVAFQASHSLDDDGIVGPNTWKALVTSSGGGTPPPPGGGGTERQQLAKWLLDSPNTAFLRNHIESGHAEYHSTPGGSIEETAAGRKAWTSSWSHVGEHTVDLNLEALRAMKKISSEKGFRYRVSSLTGGRHSAGSAHYSGRAVDFDVINGVEVGEGANHLGLMQACRDYGADLTLGPNNDPSHQTHVHCQWN